MVRVWVHIIIYANASFGKMNSDEFFSVKAKIANTSMDSDIVVACLNGIDNHFHFIVHLGYNQTIQDVVDSLKNITRRILKAERRIDSLFAWSPDFLALSVSSLLFDLERHCIDNQEAYHSKKDLSDEVTLCINECKLDYQILEE